MTKQKKICFAVVITMMLCIIGIFVLVLQKGKKYAFSYLETSTYLPLIQGELLELTGYVRGGCSPVGMKKQYPTYVEAMAMEFAEIAISGGRCRARI